MAGNVGTVEIDFGSFGSNEANVSVTGQTGILSTSYVGVGVMGDTTTDHGVNDHRYFSLISSLIGENIIAGVGFTIFATSEQKLTGKFKIRWVWVD